MPNSPITYKCPRCGSPDVTTCGCDKSTPLDNLPLTPDTIDRGESVLTVFKGTTDKYCTGNKPRTEKTRIERAFDKKPRKRKELKNIKNKSQWLKREAVSQALLIQQHEKLIEKLEKAE